jgi:[protein-PII] uridylyltransferase
VWKSFYEILDRDGAARALRFMHEVGFLGALIPEFGQLAFLPQYDVFHRYTADEHTLKAVQYVEELSETDVPSMQELRRIYLGLKSPAVIKMALILHDIGKSGGAAGHVERGLEIGRTVLDRWPLGEKASKQILLLAANHLIMNRTAQRRDMHDEKIVREFCDAMGSVENLKLMYLLTYADLRAVGPEVWTEWKGALLLELYQRAKDYMTREPEERLTGRALVDHLREVVTRELVSDVTIEAIEAYFQAMPYKYIASTSAERIVQHIRLGEKMVTQEGLALEHWHNQQFGYTEVQVCTTGRTGIFSEIAGTLTSKNLNILGAQIYTRTDNIAIDTLQVERLEGGCVTDEEIWRDVEKNLRAIVRGTETVEALLERRTRYVTEKRYVGPPVKAEVAINNRISDTHTVIEMKAHDRLGLLYLVTHTMMDFHLDIYLAKISTEGNRAVNVFYVTDLEGEQIFDEDLISHIRNSLLTVLEEGEIG